MPPRPPVTTLAIHAWKEHGKPRPLSNEEASVASARARISRSLSVEAQLTVDASLSRSSTFDDLDAMTAQCNRLAMLRSCSVDDGLKRETRPDILHSSPVMLTPLESDDEETRRWEPADLVPSAALTEESQHPQLVQSRPDLLPPRPRRHRHSDSLNMPAICEHDPMKPVGGATTERSLQAAHVFARDMPGRRPVRLRAARRAFSREPSPQRHVSVISHSTSYDAGLSMLAHPTLRPE